MRDNNKRKEEGIYKGMIVWVSRKKILHVPCGLGGIEGGEGKKERIEQLRERERRKLLQILLKSLIRRDHALWVGSEGGLSGGIAFVNQKEPRPQKKGGTPKKKNGWVFI